MASKTEERTFDQLCSFSKSVSENKITGMLEVDPKKRHESSVEIDGSRSLLSHIPDIRYIHLLNDKVWLSQFYVFMVYGRCPDNYMEIEISFKDGEGNTHTMGIISEKNRWHSEKFSCKQPQITEISWSFMRIR